MNTELLNQVADLIEKTDRFDLNQYAGQPTLKGRWRYKEVTPAELWANCNTAGCVCGWVNALTDGKEADDDERAGHLLGLTDDQADELFTPRTDDAEGTVWQMDNPYAATAAEAAVVLRELAAGKRTFGCDA